MVETNGRRRFLSAVGAGLGAALAQRWPVTSAQTPLITLTDWLDADASARSRNVRACLDRIRAEDSAIHAWVQVEPQDPTGAGVLSGIPFGVKYIIETLGQIGRASWRAR